MRYDPVIRPGVKTAISLPGDTFRRIDDAAKRLGVSRSEFRLALQEHLGTLPDWLIAQIAAGILRALALTFR